MRGSRPLALVLSAISAIELASCHAGARKDEFPPPESEQVIGEAMKDLYMAAAAAPPQSPQQQKVILRMAQKASNGKELLLVMRAANGVFPSAGDPPQQRQIHAIVTAKMLQFATLDQLTDYAVRNPVGAEIARPYVERMFRLGSGISDPLVWYRIQRVAIRLGVSDLEQQAQARADQLAR